MLRVSDEQLRRITRTIFEGMGAPSASASVVADSLVSANLMGHDSHGVIRIPHYAGLIREGRIRPDARPTVAVDSRAFAVVDGAWGFGQLAGRLAAQVAAEKAATEGLGAVAVRSCNHMGRIGEYPEMIAAQGMVGLAFANSPSPRPRVAPFGGIRPCLSPDVIAAAVPRPGGNGEEAGLFVLDMSCAVIPEGKVRVCRNRGVPLPEGAAIDAQGQPITDPAAYYGPPEGALLPFGGPVAHKGYGLLLLCEILAGALSGAGCSGEDVTEGNGLFLLAANPAAFGPAEAFTRRIEDLFHRMKECPTAPGVDEVLVPGEVEMRIMRERRREGIPIDDETWRQIQEVS